MKVKLFEEFLNEKKLKLKPGSLNTVVTGTFEIRAAQDFGSANTETGPFRVQLLLNSVPTGPSFTVRKGKVISTYGGDLNSYQDIIASLLKSKGFDSYTAGDKYATDFHESQ